MHTHVFIKILCISGLVLSQLREFSEAELEEITGGFKEIVGQGSFGCVYRGVCKHTAVAIKVLDPVSLA